MADSAAQPEPEAPRPSRLPLLVGLGAGLAAAAGGYYAVSAGLLGGGAATETHAPDEALAPVADTAFVPLEPLLVSLGRGAPARNLRFEATLEVAPGSEARVAALMPRIMDVLNGYLRAIETADIEDPAALIRLRAQMLRRIQTVTGDGAVRDLLIAKFLIS